MNLNGVIRNRVGNFSSLSFAHRGKNGRNLVVIFLFCADFVSDIFTFFYQCIIGIAQINRTCGFIKQGTGGEDFHLHGREHIVDRREVVNAFLELFALGGIFFSFKIGGFCNTQSLSTDRNTRSVHQTHYITCETAAALSAELCRDIVVLQFSSGYTVNAELMFNAAYYQLRASFSNEH